MCSVLEKIRSEIKSQKVPSCTLIPSMFIKNLMSNPGVIVKHEWRLVKADCGFINERISVSDICDIDWEHLGYITSDLHNGLALSPHVTCPVSLWLIKDSSFSSPDKSV